MNQRLSTIALLLGVSGASGLVACGSSSAKGSPDASTESATDAPSDAGADSPPRDAGRPVVDAGPDASITGIQILPALDAALQAAPGDAVQLKVVYTLSNGQTQLVPFAHVTWTSPATVTAQDPNDAGPGSVLPEAGAAPTAFFVNNPYRESPPGVLFVTDPGTAKSAVVSVTASVPDAGSTSATVAILPAPVGDPAHGQMLFQTVISPTCTGCHGKTGAGSPPIDGGEAGTEYALPSMSGELFPYPAPGLNDAPKSGNLANDPTWTAGLLGMAVQSDIDNEGVALRAPMPVFLSASDGKGALGAQDFADIYAWMKTQKH